MKVDMHFIAVPKTASCAVILYFCETNGIPVLAHTANYGKWSSGLRRLKDKAAFFAVVRDPVDRLVSAWSFLRGGGMSQGHATLFRDRMAPFGSLDSFILSPVFDLLAGERLIFMPQRHWLVKPGTDTLLDRLDLLPYETLQKSLDTFAMCYGFTPRVLQHANTSYRTEEYLSDSSREKILEVYSCDYALIKGSCNTHVKTTAVAVSPPPKNRIAMCLVAETTPSFVNQVKLCLFSFRRYSGMPKDTPVVLVTNDKPLADKDKKFMALHFSPIRFVVRPRINIIPPASKMHVFDLLPPEEYDAILFMDCDTVVTGSLEGILDPVLSGECDFLCRRGGGSDRSAFTSVENTLQSLGCNGSPTWVIHNGQMERPHFNTGVFAFTPRVARKIGEEAMSIMLKIIDKPEHLKNKWMGEQCAIALACVTQGVKVKYLHEIYNSWGNLEDIRILHCFKSRYKFDRATMFSGFESWRKKHEQPYVDPVPGEKKLVRIVAEFIKANPDIIGV